MRPGHRRDAEIGHLGHAGPCAASPASRTSSATARRLKRSCQWRCCFARRAAEWLRLPRGRRERSPVAPREGSPVLFRSRSVRRSVAGPPPVPRMPPALVNRAEACEYQGPWRPERTPGAHRCRHRAQCGMAAERTWLAWWRSVLVATAGALGVGRLAPRLLHAAPAPYVVLGCCYALLAGALLVVALIRCRAIERAVERGEPALLAARTVALFTIGAIARPLSSSPRSSRALPGADRRQHGRHRRADGIRGHVSVPRVHRRIAARIESPPPRASLSHSRRASAYRRERSLPRRDRHREPRPAGIGIPLVSAVIVGRVAGRWSTGWRTPRDPRARS
jgi:uncharacterized membrane protein YidH (DUF202 family)